MKDQVLTFFGFTLLIILQVFMWSNAFDNEQSENVDEPCLAPNGASGHCLPYAECANLTNWRIQNNLKTADDVKKMLCKNDNVHICCNRTNYYFPDTNYITQLNPKGLAILKEIKCGRVMDSRISKGEPAALGQYPFMALLKYDIDDGKFLCGGSLITSSFVLTAAHCISSQLHSVRLGEHDTSTEVDCSPSLITFCQPKAEDYEIVQHILHPKYRVDGSANDVALLKLSSEVKIPDHIKPICLPITQMVYDHSNAIERYTIAGWGNTEYTLKSDILQHAEIPRRARAVCERVFSRLGKQITYNHICAGGENQIDTCKGDSGGPLFATVPFKLFNSIKIYRQVQFGIVSLGFYNCGGRNVKAAAYVNLMKFMPWITEVIADHTPDPLA